jgi:5-methylcytosine-specific restriction endonuclease McrA
MAKVNADSQKHFERVVNNAFDFLEHSLKQLKDDPKHSVINYYSAIELFFKARLMCEHWALIVTKPESANHNNFRMGNFHSVSLKECKKRIENICGQSCLSEEDYKILETLRDHRNRLVHFFHDGYQKKQDSVIHNVMLEQFKAWLVICKLLKETWKAEFEIFESQVHKIDKLFHEHYDFLEKKYKNLKPEIESLIEKGKVVYDCPSCDFKSFKEVNGKILESDIYFECMVCKYTHPLIAIKCPDCQKTNFIFNLESFLKCNFCKSKITLEKLLEQYRVNSTNLGEADSWSSKFLCPKCGHDKIIRLPGQKFYCLDCMEEYYSFEECDFCHHYNLGGVGENSYEWGCAFCNGNELD